MKRRNFWYLLILVAFVLLPLAGCSGGGDGTVVPGEKGTSLTVSGTVSSDGDTGKTLGKIVSAVTDPLSGTVSVLNAADSTVLGSTAINADGSFSGLTFTLPATKSLLVFKASTNKSATPFYTVVPIDLSNPPAAGIGVSNAISIVISQASTNIASTVSSSLGLTGILGETGNALPAGQSYTTVAQLVTQYGGQVLAYNTSGLSLTGVLKESLLPAQDANALTGDELNNIVLDGVISNVAIPGNNPIVSFQVTNKATGKGIRGLKSFSMAIAQLKPAASGAPSEWLSYMVSSATSRPGTDSGYTVLDNGDGSYTVKFGKNVKGVSAYGVTYDANLTHRVAVQARTAPAAALTSTGTSVTNFKNEKIMFFDFVPANPSATPTELRNIVKTEACLPCHTKLGVSTPHGGRGDVRYCMMCHTSQRANGQTASTSVSGAFTGTTYVADGEVVGEFVTMIHKIHMGEELTKTGYNYADVHFNHIVYPQPITNCRTCHVEDTATQPQALNWKEKPSRKACGSCHDNINFATGANAKVGGTAHIPQASDVDCATCHNVNSTSFSPDAVHKPVTAPDPNNTYLGGTNGNTNASYLVGSQTNLPAGVNSIAYDVKEVTKVANATDPLKFNPAITFKLKKNGTDVVFQTYAAGVTTEMMAGYVGAPSVYFAWSVPQDGIAAPADYNATASTYIKNMWRGDGKDTKGANLGATAQGTMTGPDASGYYTITLTGVFIPDTAKMLTGGVGYTYSLSATPPLTQIDVAKYPYTPNPSTVNAGVGGTGGISVPAPNVWKVATGYTGRRLIVDNAKCNGCHAQIGVGPNFHAGQRNDAQTCSFCHYPNRDTGHKTDGGGWSVNVKDMVHAIHGASIRTNAFTYEATAANTLGFGHVGYPGVLNNCESCHIPGMYDFSAAINPGHGAPPIYTYTPELVSSLLWSNGITGTPVAGISLSPFVTAGTNYGANFGYNANTGITTPAAGTTLVISPITAACFSCHDSGQAIAHMRANGGSVYAPRSTAFSSVEQCLVCHGPGKTADIKAVHRM